ncbi:MAG TPA: hypothetical protein VFV99_10750 [Kofleriaceae bacterium]|nr:hypothetical protein [Kofleriaceae bacterium]
MGRFLVVAVALCAFGACKDKNKSDGLPPAQEWSANAGGAMPPAGPSAQNPHGTNPHAAMGGGDQGGGEGNMPPGHPPIDNPHGGGSPDVAAMGIPGPDPNRKINPNNRVKGVIKVHAKAKDRVKAGGAVFVIVKRSVDGAPSGPPLAVDKLTWDKDELPFEMTEKQAMIAGTELTGEVIVIARYDQDGDAISKQPGDVSGSVKVKIPADKVTLTLDDVLQ